MNNYYRIYGKEKTAKKYKALDYHAGALVDNLIYATLIYEKEKESALKMISYLNQNNPQFIFELRKV